MRISDPMKAFMTSELQAMQREHTNDTNSLLSEYQAMKDDLTTTVYNYNQENRQLRAIINDLQQRVYNLRSFIDGLAEERDETNLLLDTAMEAQKVAANYARTLEEEFVPCPFEQSIRRKRNIEELGYECIQLKNQKTYDGIDYFTASEEEDSEEELEYIASPTY